MSRIGSIDCISTITYTKVLRLYSSRVMLAILAAQVVFGASPSPTLEDSSDDWLSASFKSDDVWLTIDQLYPFVVPTELMDPIESEASRSWVSSGSFLALPKSKWRDFFVSLDTTPISSAIESSLSVASKRSKEEDADINALPAFADSLSSLDETIPYSSLMGIDLWTADDCGVSMMTALRIGQLLVQQSEVSLQV